jgi:hypothetical protein
VVATAGEATREANLIVVVHRLRALGSSPWDLVRELPEIYETPIVARRGVVDRSSG